MLACMPNCNLNCFFFKNLKKFRGTQFENAPDRSILLKLSIETTLESKSFETLIDFLAFLLQKLWPKINKTINYLIGVY